MSYPLPSIFIAPSRRAEVRDDMAARLYVQLRSELMSALLGDPQTLVYTPGFKPRHTSASDVFFDDFAGTDSDARRDTLIRILGDAAKGEDVQLRASALLADIASRHAEFHEVDALAAEGF